MNHHTLFFLLVVIITSGTHAQSVAIKMQKAPGGNFDDILVDMAVTNDHGIIAGGYSFSGSVAEKTQASKGLDDYWIVKYGVNGFKEWDKTIGGNLSDELSVLKKTNDGGYILAGSSSSNISGDKTSN